MIADPFTLQRFLEAAITENLAEKYTLTVLTMRQALTRDGHLVVSVGGVEREFFEKPQQNNYLATHSVMVKVRGMVVNGGLDKFLRDVQGLLIAEYRPSMVRIGNTTTEIFGDVSTSDSISPYVYETEFTVSSGV